MPQVSLIEALLLFIAIALWGFTPRDRNMKWGLHSVFIAICLLGIAINYIYLLSIPTHKTVLPFFILEKKDHSVMTLDFGQIFALLLITHLLYLYLERRRTNEREATDVRSLTRLYTLNTLIFTVKDIDIFDQ